jgi:hypothetical protein
MMTLKKIALSFLTAMTLTVSGCGLDNPAKGTGYEIHKELFGDKVYYAYDSINPITNALNVQAIDEADAKTFNIFQQKGWAKDAKHVFYAGELKPDIDSATFEVLNPTSGGYARDKQHVYLDNGQVLANALPESFEIINEGHYPIYARDKQQVYFEGTVIADAQPDSFKILSHGYARDKQHIYFNSLAYNGNKPVSVVLNNAQPDSFEIINPDESSELIYAHDKQQVYLNGNVLTNAQPDSFEILNTGYAHDKQQVYFNGKLLADAQPDSFKIINPEKSGYDSYNSYARDKNHVYRNDTLIANALPESFEIISPDPFVYARDKQQVYFKGKVLANAQPDFFKILEPSADFASDGHNYFFTENTVTICDIASFKLQPVNYGTWEQGLIWGYDKKCYYVRGDSLPIADAKTFQVLPSNGTVGTTVWYAKDSAHVYWSNTVVADADPETFHLLDSGVGGFAQDKNKCYRYDSKVIDLTECKK